MSRIDAIFLDLDGTLTDPKVGITRCVQHALGELGATPPDADELTWCIGPPLSNSMIGATDNGMRAVGVLYGYGSREELEASGAELLVSKPDELSGLLNVRGMGKHA